MQHELEKQRKRLHSPLPRQRALAARALGDLGAEAAVVDLLELGEEIWQEELRKSIAYALEKLGALDALFARFQEAEGYKASYLLSLLQDVRYEEAWTPRLLELLCAEDGDDKRRLQLAILLSKTSQKALVSQELVDFWEATERQEGDRPRREAWLRALGELGHESALPILRQVLEDMSFPSGLRGHTARMLGNFQREEDIERLAGVLQERDFYDKMEVVAALARIGGSRVVAPLVQAYENSYGYDKESILQHIVKVAPQVATGLLGSALERRYDEWVRLCDYVKMLGQIGTPEALAILHQELLRVDEDEDLDENFWYVRGEIADVLGEVADPSSLPYLERAIWIDDIYEYAELNATKALAQYPPDQVIPILMRTFTDNHSNTTIMQKASETLKRLEVTEPLCALVRAGELPQSKYAARMLRYHNTPEALTTLYEALQSPQAELVNETIASLSFLKPEGLATTFLKLAQERPLEELHVWYLFGVFEEDKTKAAIPLLLDCLSREPVPGLSSLVKALGALEVKEAAPRLLELLEASSDGWNAEALIDALVALQAQEGTSLFVERFDTLIGLYHEEGELDYGDKKMLVSVIRALGRPGAENALPAFDERAADLIELTASEDWDLRSTAFEALNRRKHPARMRLIEEELGRESNHYNTELLMACFEESEEPAMLARLLEMLRGHGVHENARHYRRRDAVKSAGLKVGDPTVVKALLTVLEDAQEDRDLRWLCAQSLTYHAPSCIRQDVLALVFAAFEDVSFHHERDLKAVLASLERLRQPLSSHIQTLQAQAPAQGAVDELEELFVMVHEIHQLFDAKFKGIDEYKENYRPEYDEIRRALSQAKRDWSGLVDLLRHNVLERLQHDWEEVLFL